MLQIIENMPMEAIIMFKNLLRQIAKANNVPLEIIIIMLIAEIELVEDDHITHLLGSGSIH